MKNWLTLLNYSLGALASALMAAAIGVTLVRPTAILPEHEFAQKSTLPKGAFALSKDKYDAIGDQLLALKMTPIGMQLPDLRKDLIYYGINGRPDAQISTTYLHFSFNGNKTIHSLEPGKRFFVCYDREATPPQYVFTENNEESPFWIEVEPAGQQALVKAILQSDTGEQIQDPPSHAQFTLASTEFAKTGNSPKELGKWKIDGSLLARQKARWYGFDRFLEKHGGEEFLSLTNKQRIDFGENEEIYSVFLAQNDCLIWENERWNVVKPGPDSLGHPLLVVKRIDERLMNFELWDAEGKAKAVLNLLKSSEPFAARNLENMFHFVGARTRSQFVFEIDDKRMLLRPHDWLVQTEDGWVKLSTPDQIDDYVGRKICGPLFVFDGITRKDDKQVLMGTMFNPSRTDMQPIELCIQGGPANHNGGEKSDDYEDNMIENPVAQFQRPNFKS